MKGLRDRNAIVTGAGGAIGGAIADRLAEARCVVGVFDVDGGSAATTVERISAAGGRAFAETVDITDHAAVARAVASFEGKAGPTDILVNNAGWDRFLGFLDTEPAFWRKVISINLEGHLNLHHVVAPGMFERRRGAIVNIASDAGRVGSSGEAVYSACKGGLIAFTKTLARELASAGVRVNAVCPGPTETPLFQSFLGEGDKGKQVYEALRRAIPFRRFGQPDDVAGIVTFLASDEASYITGQVISVSGGLTMAG